MSTLSYLSIAALVGLLPVTIQSFRPQTERRMLFWCSLAVAVAGCAALTIVTFSTGWRTGFSPALWATITATLVIFVAVSAFCREGHKLASGLLPYLIVLGTLAVIWQNQAERPFLTSAPTIWVLLHIGFSLATYAVLTLAAIAGLSALIQERSLKTKRETILTAAFPTLSASEALEARLLGYSAAILVVGLLTGMTIHYLQTGSLFDISHKALLSILTLVIVVVLLIARKVSGLRGQKAARLALLAYLMLTLAYPGVKFVTDILLV
jgi:ABC-type uncharacterized transport system permease subunit